MSRFRLPQNRNHRLGHRLGRGGRGWWWGWPTVADESADPGGAHRRAGADLTSDRAFRRVYLTVPVGGVEITPSREALRDTDRTVRAVRWAVATLPGQVLGVVQHVIGDAADLPAAAWAADRCADPAGPGPAAGRDRLTHDGQPIPLTANVPLRHLDRVLVVTGIPKGAAAHRYLLAHRDDLTWLVYSPADSGLLGAFAFGPDRPVRTMSYRDLRERVNLLGPPEDRPENTYLTMVPGQQPRATERGAGWLREQPRPAVVLTGRTTSPV